ncbi:hypothetical protein FA15DRAFT_654743 [Coprinopsis marcescibilis]|uniref:Uncharacterized protein n=1 Tax=Coprinopsis marcescibilis TaxID=230819 RepID=A0A5C3KZX6_COPMA|nr:hypothetical protein FA15DRAFT_654743 [Coprinopsis marcescibilis]
MKFLSLPPCLYWYSPLMSKLISPQPSSAYLMAGPSNPYPYSGQNHQLHDIQEESLASQGSGHCVKRKPSIISLISSMQTSATNECLKKKSRKRRASCKRNTSVTTDGCLDSVRVMKHDLLGIRRSCNSSANSLSALLAHCHKESDCGKHVEISDLELLVDEETGRLAMRDIDLVRIYIADHSKLSSLYIAGVNDPSLPDRLKKQEDLILDLLEFLREENDRTVAAARIQAYILSVGFVQVSRAPKISETFSVDPNPSLLLVASFVSLSYNAS